MFYIDENGIVYPLGAKLLRDSRIELIPGTTDISDTIEGMHGEISHGSRYEPREFSLHMAIDCPPKERGSVKRKIAKALQPSIFQPQSLEFADDLGKVYYVKYIGEMSSVEYMDGLEFTVPFKVSRVFAEGVEKVHMGSGILQNEGDVETPVVVEVVGTISNPSISIAGESLKYTGTLSSTSTLIIDTGKMTVTFNGCNAMHRFDGGFPFLQQGETAVTAPDNATFRWRDRWL